MNKFEITLGVNSGYNHNNELDFSVEDVGEVWQELLEKNNLCISVNITKQVTCYREKFGCPIGGEDTFLLSGIRHQQYDPDEGIWLSNLKKLTRQLSETFQQQRVYIVIHDAKCIILENKDYE